MNKQPLIRSDGKYLRDYIFVLDAVSAYLALGEALLAGKGRVMGEAFNFGTGRPITVMELVNAIIKISGKNIKARVLNIASGEIRKQYLSSNKAGNILGWVPRCDLRSAVKQTYEWYERYFERAL